MGKLFEEDFGVDNSPKDDTDIMQVLLYFSKPEYKRFKELCKTGLDVEFGKAKTEKNISDFLLQMLENNYGLI